MLAKADERIDSAGERVRLEEGLIVFLYMEDSSGDGVSDPLLAEGSVELNRSSDWSSHVKWLCRITPPGAVPRSER